MKKFKDKLGKGTSSHVSRTRCMYILRISSVEIENFYHLYCSPINDSFGQFFQISMIEWTKNDDKMLDYTVNGEENKLR